MPAATPKRRRLTDSPAISIVVPILNEAGNITPLVHAINAAFAKRAARGAIEIIIVNDASTDGSARELAALQKTIRHLRVLTHATRCGQSEALRSGIFAARAPLIATLDGDGQNPPSDLPALEAAMHAAKKKNPAVAVMAAGYRAKRRDGFAKRAASRFARAMRRVLLADDHPDTGCATKVFERDLYIKLPYFNHMHRFLPVLARREGAEVLAIPVEHAPRNIGESKYRTLDRLAVGVSDMLGVIWLMRRKPANVKVTETSAKEKPPKKKSKRKKP